MLTRSSAGLIAAAALVGMAGCDSGPEMVGVVEGTVTLAGKPLEKVRVDFTPLAEGPQSSAITDAQGRFALKTLDGTQPGAVMGKHKVTLIDQSIITLPFKGRESETVDLTQGKKPRISNRYSNVMSTPLEVEVTGETRDIKLEPDAYSAGAGARRER